MKLALVISGHERSGLSDMALYQFIERLSTRISIDLYLHSWDVSDVPRTWRESTEQQIRPISTKYIMDYFTFQTPNVTIKYIKVESDKGIRLEQTTDGYVSQLLPKVCWKNMWYAKFKCIQQLESEVYDAVLMTRFDIFTYGVYTTPIRTKVPQVVDLVATCSDLSKIHFLDHTNPTLQFLSSPQYKTQADNFVYGNPRKIAEFVRVFHFHLDDLIRDSHRVNYNHFNQEFLALGEGFFINYGQGSLRKYHKILIVGCGLTGATIARRLADEGYLHITIIDKRNHIAGNCYDYMDKQTGLVVNKYGAHIFHTSDKEVINFVKRFSSWIPYTHKVKARVEDGVYVSVPANINTVNKLCGQHIQSEQEMVDWMRKTCPHYNPPRNSEEMALSRVGPVMYERLIKWYTKKQWDKFPSELDASVLARIPMRTNHDEGYFNDSFQALPQFGYTAMVRAMLSHPNINVILGEDFFQRHWDAHTTFYTGPIDQYFKSRGFPSLEYRSIDFIEERVNGTFQPYAVVNYPNMDTPYTRSVEYKHFPNQKSTSTLSIVVHERTTDHGEPYYPIPNERNRQVYSKYQELATRETNVRFIGRLASYKYLNMDQAIRCALDEVYAFVR